MLNLKSITQLKYIYNILYKKSQMHLAAWNKSTDIAITITISINMIGFGAFLTKYTDNKYIYIYFKITLYVYLLKMLQFPKINVGNSLSGLGSPQTYFIYNWDAWQKINVMFIHVKQPSGFGKNEMYNKISKYYAEYWSFILQLQD